jgi:hypothetical protein
MQPQDPSSEEQNSQPAAAIGQVFTPGSPTESQAPAVAEAQPPRPSAAQPDTVSAQPAAPVSVQPPQEPAKKRSFKPSKKLALLAGVPTLLLAGGAAAYFGYVVPNKPENVWRTALTNTAKGYDKLSQYATSKKGIKGIGASGSFKLSGAVAADGSFKGSSDSKNGQFAGNVSAAGLKVNYDVRAIESPGNSPDIYFKIDGVQGLGDLFSGFTDGGVNADNAEITKALNGLNGQWYFVDHTLFDQFAKGSNENLQISSADVSGALKAVGDSSKQYLFTNDPQKMAIVVKQNAGKEKQDGRSVYHYKIGINKNNLKAYNKSLCDNLIKTKLFKLFSAGGSADEDFTKECNDSTGIDKIKDSQTADAWVDLHTKLIHKIRFSDPKNSNNYTDIVQDYQGGDEFPFSIAVHSITDFFNYGPTGKGVKDTSSGIINMKLNMKTNTFSVNANFETTGSNAYKIVFNLAVAPTNEKVKAEKPTGAKTIIELINDLGIGGLTAGTQSNAKDTERKTDINSLEAQLEVFYTENGNYPTLSNLNDSAWRKTNLKDFHDEILKDPEGAQTKLSAAPAARVYSYQPGPANCTAADCSSYTLSATLGDGTVYTKQSLN